MNADRTVALISIAGALILSGAALYRQRLGTRQLWGLALLWIPIIATIAGAIDLGLELR